MMRTAITVITLVSIIVFWGLWICVTYGWLPSWDKATLSGECAASESPVMQGLWALMTYAVLFILIGQQHPRTKGWKLLAIPMMAFWIYLLCFTSEPYAGIYLLLTPCITLWMAMRRDPQESSTSRWNISVVPIAAIWICYLFLAEAHWLVFYDLQCELEDSASANLITPSFLTVWTSRLCRFPVLPLLAMGATELVIRISRRCENELERWRLGLAALMALLLFSSFTLAGFLSYFITFHRL